MRLLSGDVDRIGMFAERLDDRRRRGKQEAPIGQRLRSRGRGVDLIDRLIRLDASGKLAAVGSSNCAWRLEIPRASARNARTGGRVAPHQPVCAGASAGPSGIDRSDRTRVSRAPADRLFRYGFSRHLPPVARILPIPREYERMGVRRYGFHGLSYAYFMEELDAWPGARSREGE